MKYRVQSANILNEADRFGGILNWTLFKFEQEKLLWGHNPKVKWTPGYPIHQDPRFIPTYDYPNNEFNLWPGYWGSTVRRMFEEIDDEENDNRRGWSWRMRCEPCGVSWEGTDECWMCGKLYPLPEPVQFSRYFEYRSLNDHSSVDAHHAALYEQMMREMWEQLNVRMAQEMVTGRTRASFASTGRRSGHTCRLQTMVDEFHNFDIETFELDAVRPHPSSFWSRDYTRPPFRVAGVEIPRNWAELRPTIPVPVTPEPRDYTDWAPGGSGPERPINRRRRRERDTP